MKLNKQVVELLLARWKAGMFSSADASDASNTASVSARLSKEDLQEHPVEILDELREQGRLVGQQRLVLGAGEFLVRWEGEWGTDQIAFDGQKFYQLAAGQKPKEMDFHAALAKPLVMAAYSLCAVLADTPLAESDVLLSGGDAARRQRSYRLAARRDQLTLHLWLSMFDTQGDPRVRLLKAGLDTEAAVLKPAVIFDDWQISAGLLLPRRRAIVTGLEEAVRLEIITRKITRLNQTLDQLGSEKP